MLAGARVAVGFPAPQEFRNAFLGDGFQLRGNAGLAEIFLRQHVAGDLAPFLGDFDVGLAEHDRAVRIADLARGVDESDAVIGTAPFHRELTPNTHAKPPNP